MICPRCQSSYDDPEMVYCGRCGTDMRAATSDPGEPSEGDLDPLLGTVIDGRYRVLARLGSGGMGCVFKVEHVAMGKIAAIKILHASLLGDRAAGKRFRREAEAISLLSHANTVQVFDFGHWQGCLYMVMEYLRGLDMGAIVRRDGPLPWSRAAPLFAQICAALTDAHEAGVIHRDLKPENVLVTRGRDQQEICKVLDFGLAKLKLAHDLGATDRGTVLGTPYFMSPEQINARELDARSDIYSLGATMYKVLTGDPPFHGATPMSLLAKHLEEAPRPLGERRPDLTFDPRVEALVARCLEKSPDRRFASAEELRQAILAIRVEGSLPGDRPAYVERRKPPSVGQAVIARREDFDRFERSLRRRRLLALATIPLTLLVAGAGSWLYATRLRAPRALEVEVEPNNATALANLISAQQPVRGQIGKRMDVESSDRDYFRLRVDQGPALFRAALTGLPEMDLHLAVYDSSGRRIAEADGAGVGGGEVVPNLRLARGEYYVEVREVWVVGRRATENVTDWYQLTAKWRPLADDEESEPDDTPATANRLPIDHPVRGYLGRPLDIDYYRPEGGGGGHLEGVVTGVEGVDLQVISVPPVRPPAIDGEHAQEIDGEGALPTGSDVFDSGGSGAGEPFHIHWRPGDQPPLVVVRRIDRTVDSRGNRITAAGLDSSYAISLTRH